MKYSRYDLRVEKKKKMFLFLLGILILAILFIIIGHKKDNIKPINDKADENISVKETNDSSTEDKKVNDTEQKQSQQADIVKFYTLQCGVFENNKNAVKMKDNLQLYGYPFIVKIDNKYKVVFGIFDEDTLNDGLKLLNDNKQEKARVTYEIKQDCLCNQEITAIINAELQIIKKLGEVDVKSVKTEELKKWVNSMKDVEKDAPNIDILSKLKNNINKFPNEISKNDIESINISLYEALKTLKE